MDDFGAGGRAGIREGGVFVARQKKDELILTFSDDVIDDVILPLFLSLLH